MQILVGVLSWKTQGSGFLHGLKRPTEGAVQRHTWRTGDGGGGSREKAEQLASLSHLLGCARLIHPCSRWLVVLCVFPPEMQFLLLHVDMEVSNALFHVLWFQIAFFAPLSPPLHPLPV